MGILTLGFLICGLASGRSVLLCCFPGRYRDYGGIIDATSQVLGSLGSFLEGSCRKVFFGGCQGLGGLRTYDRALMPEIADKLPQSDMEFEEALPRDYCAF